MSSIYTCLEGLLCSN